MTKISQLTNIGSALAGDDEFVVRDVSDVSTPNKKVTSSGIIDYIISQGSLSGFSQIAAGVGPLARVRTTTSGTTGTIIAETASAGTIAEAYRVTPDKYFRMATGTLGIQFNGDTAAENALDDYEEGTWTPDFTFSTPGDLTVSYSSQVGNYRIIGKLCIATFTLEFTPTYTTAANNPRVTGLPLSSGTYLTTPASVDRFSGFTLSDGFDNLWLRKSTGQAFVELWSTGRSGSSLLTASAVASGSAKILNGTIIYNL